MIITIRDSSDGLSADMGGVVSATASHKVG